MYNSIYPININYRKTNPYQKPNYNKDASEQGSSLPQNSSPKDNYTPASNQINISQILMDFKNTIIAINAPQDIQDEVNIYLGLVEKESNKDNPSRDIIISNLKNASRISDSYIANALGKPSNVVEGWISTIFRQNINLKSNPNEINPDFLLKFPTKKNEPEDIVTLNQEKPVVEPEILAVPVESPVEPQIESEEIKITDIESEILPPQKESVEVLSSIDVVDDESNVNIFINSAQEKRGPFTPNNDADERAKVLYSQARKEKVSQDDYKEALNMLNEALGFLNDDSNNNIKAAIHFERAKIFDKFDYVDYALRDYHEATKAQDLNLKANAYFKSGLIYDEFRDYDPALDNYLSSVAYSGEADNLSAQSKVLSKISEMYAQRFDVQNAHDYADLAIDSALDSNDSRAVANAYSAIAQNFQYLGESKNALENYKNALAEFSRQDESYEEMAYNYAQAAIVMRDLGNQAKAEKLQLRANQYYQKAQQQQELLEQAS